MPEKVIFPGEPDFYANTQFERRPHGAYVIDGIEVGHTLQCPHCGAQFLSRRGSGHRRTWCFRCHAVTCGNVECDPCVTWEQKMEMIERAAGG